MPNFFYPLNCFLVFSNSIGRALLCLQVTDPRLTCIQCHFSQDLFHTAISRYLKETKKKDLLFQLLQWMPGQGYIVDAPTRNLILKNSHLFGRQTIAELLSKQHMVSKAMRSHQSIVK